ncbi:hypothetical protein Lrub_2704 [Legionella rubrilucens]|uniref:Uncharacterized protein n=1 Tax=Legionella rubrilucens TaxID=458 RepID=A0A0W0XNC6_9GAMM|nr:hypothetical protein [Legionella rubrilucens]KTD45907.1 hypothetical protein Lrub_2704 [Legionella rubrilucens]
MAGLNKESLQEWKKKHQNARQEKQDVVVEQPKENPSPGEQVDNYNSLAEGDFETFNPNTD